MSKELRGENNPVIFSFDFYFIAFLAVSLHDELKNTIKYFLKTDLEKKSRYPGR
jgi:hypothetical protein